MRRALTAITVVGALMSATRVVNTQVSLPTALWPVASVANANRLVREKVTAARTYYVRTDGHDTNCDGKTDASDASTATTNCAFVTVQKALDAVAEVDWGIYQATVDVQGSGVTFTQALVLPPVVGKLAPILVGDTTTPSNITLTSSDITVSCGGGCRWQFGGFKITESGGSGIGVLVNYGGALTVTGKLEYGSSSVIQIAATTGGIYYNNSQAKTVSGGSIYHYYAVSNAAIIENGLTTTISGSPSFTTWAFGGSGAFIQATNITYSGSLGAGSQYNISLNAALYIAGSTLPGTGTSTSTGGQVS